MQNFTFFKILQAHACKMTLFSWFHEFAPPIEKIPLFRENGYERGIRIGGGGGGGDGGERYIVVILNQ